MEAAVMNEGVMYDRETAEVIMNSVKDYNDRPRPENVGTLGGASLIPQRFKRFELGSEWAVESGDTAPSATAFGRHWDDDTEDWVTDTDDEQIVFNTVANVSELVHNENATGSLGLAYHDHDVDRWEVVAMDQQVVRFELTNRDPGNTPYTFDPGDDAPALVVQSIGGTVIDPNDFMPIQVYDLLAIYSGGFVGDGGTRGFAKFMADTEVWEIITPRSPGGESAISFASLAANNFLLPNSSALIIPFSEVMSVVNCVASTGPSANIVVGETGYYLINFSTEYTATVTPVGVSQFVNTGAVAKSIGEAGHIVTQLYVNGGPKFSPGVGYAFQCAATPLVVDSLYPTGSMSFAAPVFLDEDDIIDIRATTTGTVRIDDPMFTVEFQGQA
jgi:hypothetical protein